MPQSKGVVVAVDPNNATTTNPGRKMARRMAGIVASRAVAAAVAVGQAVAAVVVVDPVAVVAAAVAPVVVAVASNKATVHRPHGHRMHLKVHKS